MIPNNARTLRITAAAGTELAGASSGGTVTPKVYSTPGHSSHLTGLYDPKAFFTHAALLRQGFPHCAKFLTAASRRSLARVPVPVWLIILSDQLPVVALVGHYPTN
jgi:glyoxylase-like metal-dependent hydrolase (beta-lactamase superfamily II)